MPSRSIDVGLRAAVSTVLAALVSTVARGRRSLGRVRTLVVAAVAQVHEALAGPLRRTLAGPVRTALLGRRVEVSLAVSLLAVPLAAGAAWWVAGIGFETLGAWAEGTWYGTDPNAAVLLAAAALVALAAASAAINSGLLPTALLAAGPVFGAAVTRYGTTVERGTGTAVVSLPEAVGVAALFALAVGLPLATAGFVLGAAARRAVLVFADGGPGSAAPERI